MAAPHSSARSLTSSSSSGPVLDLGVDLGTTRTVVARADRGNYPVISMTDPYGDTHDYLPSLSAWVDGQLVHGFEARAAAQQGAPVLRSLKRLLSSPQVSPGTSVMLADHQLGVLEVLTDYLRYVRRQIALSGALDGLDPSSPETNVAVAVPAHALGAQRLLTLDAFRDAGFHVTAMLNEPSAAGFEYTHRRASTVSSRRTRVVVYDLGGGTFDASVVDVRGRDHEVLASAGLSDLGGDDVDLALAELVLQEAGVEEQSLSTSARDTLLDACQEAKEGLTPQTRRIVVPLGDQDVVLPVERLYEAATPLVERSLEVMVPLVGRLEDGAAQMRDVAGVYLVGGATSLPVVGRLLRERFGRRVHRSPYPGASTAIGLAIAADRTSEARLHDVVSRAFGVFREDNNGAVTTFDAIIFPEDRQATSDGGEGTVVLRRYPAAHNIGRYRFVECAGLDAQGGPRGPMSPYAEVYFPFERELRSRSDLGELEIIRTDDGPEIEERYETDAAGLITVTITVLEDGFSRRWVLGRDTAV